MQLIPTIEEEENLIKGDISNFSRVENLLFKIIKIDRFRNKINLIDNLLRIDIKNLMSIYELKINSFLQILKCEKFHNLLLNILEIGPILYY
jgi:hypothetical protein